MKVYIVRGKAKTKGSTDVKSYSFTMSVLAVGKESAREIAYSRLDESRDEITIKSVTLRDS